MEDEDTEDRLQVMRDIVDMQLTTRDNRQIGRVADVVATWREDGTLALHALATGPETLLGRIGQPPRRLAHLLLRGRFEHDIPLSEVKDFDQGISLRGRAADYSSGQSERWIADHILRWIPGNGR
jgi:hypothetical protein